MKEEQAKNAIKWIDVKDELPELSEENDFGKYSAPVLCFFHSDSHVESCQLNQTIQVGVDPYWSYIQDGDVCEQVTHWAYLNEPNQK